MDADIPITAANKLGRTGRPVDGDGGSILSILGMLAVTKMFGMASYSVAKRMKEQGILVALGARHFAVMRSILSRLVRALLAGSAVGIVLGAMANGVMNGQLRYLPETVNWSSFSSVLPFDNSRKAGEAD